MAKPNTLKDLLTEGHITLGDVKKIARDIFDGETTGAGPEGYLLTAAKFDDLPNHVQGFIVKAILEFKVENVLDKPRDGLFMDDDNLAIPEPAEDDDNFEPPTVGNEVV